MSSDKSKEVVIVDDDPAFAELVADMARKAGYAPRVTTTSADFIEMMTTAPAGLVVMDVVLPEMDGNELLIWLANRGYLAQVILMSGYDGRYLAMTRDVGCGFGIDIVATLTKPFSQDDFQAALSRAENRGQ
ncbi:MAG: response regulator [Gammaproteobacteria bacterium]|nr:response regulator [Gammaproteobacteria bacterium]